MNCLGYVTSNQRIILKHKLERMWKKSVIFCPKAQIQHNFHGSSEEDLERDLLKWYTPTLIVDIHYLLTMNKGCEQLNCSAGLECVDPVAMYVWL
jgi:hypothetical protein